MAPPPRPSSPQRPPSASASASASAAPSDPGMPKHFLYKNLLQEYAQKSGLPIPVYHTVNEGYVHAPRFRTTVLIDGETFESLKTFPHRKEAEQEVAKIALEGVSNKIANERISLIAEDKIFRKSILNEYAVKMNLTNATYTTSIGAGLTPKFVSSALFDSKQYMGCTADSKTEAEQLAAGVVIESILASSTTRTLMSKIIKSKRRLCAPLHTCSGLGSSQEGKLALEMQSRNSSTEIKWKDVQHNFPSEGGVDNHIAPLESGQPTNAGKAPWLSPKTNKHEEYVCKPGFSSGKKHMDKYQGGLESKKARADQW